MEVRILSLQPESSRTLITEYQAGIAQLVERQRAVLKMWVRDPLPALFAREAQLAEYSSEQESALSLSKGAVPRQVQARVLGGWC